MNLAVVGSREFAAHAKIEGYIRAYLARYPDLVIVSGGARGVDREAQRIAQTVLHLPYIEFLPDYATYGSRRAPIMRNIQIIDASDMVLAFWDGVSRGTQHSIQLARQSGKPCEVISS